GLKPLGDNGGSFAQVFTIPPVIENVINGRLTFSLGDIAELRTPCTNIIGGLMGELENEAVILSAHYDHLGVYKGEIYPGANDNASGVGCVLDVTRRLVREGKIPKRSIIIAFWSAEEMGFVGSGAFIKEPTFPLDRVKAVINVDTVGNGMIGNFVTWSEGENIALQAIREGAKASGASALPGSNQGHNSDHLSFFRKGIPSVTLIARDWLTLNHTSQDNLSLVKGEQVKAAAEVVYEAVRRLAF
ncbi:MAG: M20/M25/M40 family metallo-hydrolase, partial [Desulfitobacterium hafniense]|nr:M20/M25/M40 family metallo-hydrolase [Desulfitobacterium hafniense]